MLRHNSHRQAEREAGRMLNASVPLAERCLSGRDISPCADSPGNV